MKWVQIVLVSVLVSPAFSAEVFTFDQQPQVIAKKLADVTGLSQADSRVVTALTQCLKKNEQHLQHFREVLAYLNTPKCKASSRTKQKSELQLLRDAARIACLTELHRMNIYVH